MVTKSVQIWGLLNLRVVQLKNIWNDCALSESTITSENQKIPIFLERVAILSILPINPVVNHQTVVQRNMKQIKLNILLSFKSVLKR